MNHSWYRRLVANPLENPVRPTECPFARAVRRRRQADDSHVRIDLAQVVDERAVAAFRLERYEVGLVDDHQVASPEHVSLLVTALDAGQDYLRVAIPATQASGKQADFSQWQESRDLVGVLLKQFLAVGEHNHPSAEPLDRVLAQLRDHQRLTGSRRQHDGRVPTLEREETPSGVDGLGLVPAEVHGYRNRLICDLADDFTCRLRLDFFDLRSDSMTIAIRSGISST